MSSQTFDNVPFYKYREYLKTSSSSEDARIKAAALTENIYQNLQQPGTIDSLGILYRSILKVVSDFSEYSVPGEIKIGKQQPSFIESLIETEERLQFLSQYVEQLPLSVEGLISGGSMSYGRFFNVRGGYPNSSDLDLILVVSAGLQPEDVEDIIRPDLGFQENDIFLLKRRMEIFNEFRKSEEMDVLSQKCELPARNFDISLHMIPLDVMNRMLTAKLREDYRKGDDIDIRLRDYKPSSFPHRVNKQRDFTGSIYPLVVEEYPVPEGVISYIPSYAIINNNFVPGMYHNLCSPLFEVCLDRGNIEDAMEQFKEFMCDATRDAQQKNCDAELAKSHVRYDIFSPHIRNTINSFVD